MEFREAIKTVSHDVRLSDDASGFTLLSDAVPDVILEIRYYSTYNFVGDKIDGYEEPLALLTREAASALKEVSDELKEKGSVKELYERMDNRMQRLSEAFLKSSAPDISSLSSKTEGIRENISFMNQLNQVYTYVQLPLKLMNQNANAELYVFSNKRKIDDDGTLSAFLHLDMDHLGSTDVYVKMKDKNVSNNFYFEDESAFDLIEDNIHILTQRLTEKGYNVNTTVENRSNKVDFVDDFLNQGRSAGTVHRYSFDVMA